MMNAYQNLSQSESETSSLNEVHKEHLASALLRCQVDDEHSNTQSESLSTVTIPQLSEESSKSNNVRTLQTNQKIQNVSTEIG